MNRLRPSYLFGIILLVVLFLTIVPMPGKTDSVTDTDTITGTVSVAETPTTMVSVVETPTTSVSESLASVTETAATTSITSAVETLTTTSSIPATTTMSSVTETPTTSVSETIPSTTETSTTTTSILTTTVSTSALSTTTTTVSHTHTHHSNTESYATTMSHMHTHHSNTESYVYPAGGGYVYGPGAGIASAQIYSEQPAYQMGDTIVIVINTPTGVDDAQLLIYGAYQNNFYVGSIPAGISGYPIGSASVPGPETVILAADGTQISSTMFTVEGSTETTAQYQTTTVTSYETPQFFTTETTEYSTLTSVVQSPFDLTPLFAMSAVIVMLAILTIILAIRYFSLKKIWNPNGEMMFCQNCGRTLPLGSKFCSECGAGQS